ncbi:MAG: protoheme IX farnesyltransferase [Candidatus Tectomicrobia bacterium]|uniref:Protoheme IX farnesyltransferase n=1 Tax=Tectimicrobiota bacterium TaxID=2528274 RepID=A0A932HZ73_UNCTE|nr:protoheme IX farnesyltransferase [Candidatus Tectomicrobia bacterium]
MSFRAVAIGIRRGAVSRRLTDYLSLTKPRLVPMVLMATAAGYYLASRGGLGFQALIHTLVGTALSTGGTLALNQAAEEDLDARMARTRTRPLPGGRLMQADALVFGGALVVGGLFYLSFLVNPLTGLLTGMAGASYLLLYTPLKRVTSLNSVVGALPGALPPVIGWAAAAGELSLGAFVLFAILFIWQIPHALAIGMLYREEFLEAGVRLLPVEEPDGRSTGRQAVSYCLALLPTAMMPSLIGLAGTVYFFVALILGLVYLAFAVLMARERTTASARRLFGVSLVYLPLVLLVMALDPRGP